MSTTALSCRNTVQLASVRSGPGGPASPSLRCRHRTRPTDSCRTSRRKFRAGSTRKPGSENSRAPDLRSDRNRKAQRSRSTRNGQRPTVLRRQKKTDEAAHLQELRGLRIAQATNRLAHEIGALGARLHKATERAAGGCKSVRMQSYARSRAACLPAPDWSAGLSPNLQASFGGHHSLRTRRSLETRSSTSVIGGGRTYRSGRPAQRLIAT